MLLSLVLTALMPTPPAAKHLLEDLQTHFWDPSRGLYREFAAPGPDQPAFIWGGGVLLSAYVAAGAVNPKHRPKVSHWLEVFATYRFQEAYNPAPGATDDRYYDDNAWVALALMEAHEAWQEPGALAIAERLHAWVMTGEAPDGGIFWHRSRVTRNTCSTANTALVALKLYRATGRAEFLAQADRLLAWLENTLQAPSGRFWDNVRPDGTVEQTEWSYNTALPIRAYLERFHIKKDHADLKKAVWIGRASRAHWQRPDGAIACDAAFAHHLAEAWWELADVDARQPWRKWADQALAVALSRTRTAEGLFGKRWEVAPREGPYALLAAASAARAAWKQPGR